MPFKKKIRVRTITVHLIHLSRDRIVHVAIEWAPEGDSRKRRRPTKTWLKTCNGNLTEMEITWNEANEIAKDRILWRNLVAQCPGRNRRNRVYVNK